MNAATRVTGNNKTVTGASRRGRRSAFAEARSPLGFRGGLSNLTDYVGDDPTNAADPTGEDFIAVGDRNVKGPLFEGPTLFWHYDLEYWESDLAIPKKDWAHEMTVKQMKQDYKGKKLELLHTVELDTSNSSFNKDRNVDWKVWEWHKTTKKWTKVDVIVSVIVFDMKKATHTLILYSGTNQEVKDVWDKIAEEAKKYKFAEQVGYEMNGFKNWPNSQYIVSPTANNSNTFARNIATRALPDGTFHEMASAHPGRHEPWYVPNVYGDQLPFDGKLPAEMQPKMPKDPPKEE